MKTVFKVLLILALTSCQPYDTNASSSVGTPGAGTVVGTPPPIPAQEQPEVLNEGPMHEAFAQPVDLNAQPGIIAPNEPPPVIIENPSAERPKGTGYVWIPGYWGWSPESREYIWVSGCWRIPPANMSWVPGYWNKVDGGWQWIAGFWIPTAQASQIKYLPEPPELTDTEPPTTVTVSGQIWVPPCYYWRDNRYILRSGYWLVPQPNWVWIPSHYAWTPYGYVFVAGYWDYALSTRGILYAPVYFPRRYYRMSGYSYSLSVIVDLGNLEFSLFSYPRYCHYFFGDYYSSTYLSLGIYPWFEFQTRHTWYDPLYEYDRWHYRQTIPHWGEHIRQEYDLRRNDVSLRPPRTYRELQNRLSRAPVAQRNQFRMVEPLHDHIANNRTPLQFSRMNNRELRSVRNQSNEVNNFRHERSRIENRQTVPQRTQPSTQPRIPQQRMPEQRVPERRPGISGVPEQRVPERRPGISGVPEQRVPERRPGITTAPSGRSQAGRSGIERRSAPERMTFPRSPVTARRPGGLGALFGGGGNRSPSRPQSESRFERSAGQAGRSQSEAGGGGRGRR